MPEKARQTLFISAILLGVNLFLFVAFPHYVIRKDAAGNNTELIDDFRALQVLHMDIKRPDEKPDQPEDRPEPEEPEKHTVPRRVDMQEKVVRERPRELEIDPMDLRMNPRLASGIKVSAPPMPNPKPMAFDGQFSQGEVDTVPMAMVKTPPVYPYQAKRLNLSGEVKVRFLVTRDGAVSNVEIVSAEPSEIFNKSVIRAVSAWRFKPGRISGHPVDTWMVTSIIFNIDNV